MKQHSFEETTRTAAATWTWFTLQGYSCDLDYIDFLKKFILFIGHDESTTIPACPLLKDYHYNMSDEIVRDEWKIFTIDLFL